MKTQKTNDDNLVKMSEPKVEIENFIKNFEDFLDISTLEKIQNLKKKIEYEPSNLALVQDLINTLESYCYVENGNLLKYSTHPNYKNHIKEARKNS